MGAVIVATWIAHGLGSLADERLAVVAASDREEFLATLELCPNAAAPSSANPAAAAAFGQRVQYWL